MKSAAILTALTLVAGIALAQTPAAKPGSIEGVVTNSVTNEPVKKAVVTLDDPKSHATRTASTDAEGHFQFDGVNPGAYSLAADRDGFQSSSQARRQIPPVTVAEEQQVKDVALQLVPLATLSGHVLDDDGDPVVRAQVTVLNYVYNQGPKQFNQTAFAQSNDLGEFEALNLPPGRYYIRVMTLPNGNIPPHTRWTHTEEAYPVVFYPNASEAAQATAFERHPRRAREQHRFPPPQNARLSHPWNRERRDRREARRERPGQRGNFRIELHSRLRGVARAGRWKF